MIVLGFETSCDETAVALVKDGKEILSSIVWSQIKEHAPFGGVVPELASRQHLEHINRVVQLAFDESKQQFSDVDVVAVTQKPGLVGALLIGIATAKAFAFQYECPLVPVNHLEAHLYAAQLQYDIDFPSLGLVVSGGHTLLYYSESPTKHHIIATTIDDAIGEVFDKVANFFHLGYPGGPVIDKLAKQGDPNAFVFPKPSFHKFNHEKKFYYFSYSGLKTAVIHQNNQFLKKGLSFNIFDLLASFQNTAVDILVDVLKRAESDYPVKSIIVTGGVACNSLLRLKLDLFFKDKVYFPSPSLCTDNAAMVAGLAYCLYQDGIRADLSLNAVPKIICKSDWIKSIPR